MPSFQQYNLKCNVDVAVLTHSPQAAYEFFQAHWMAEYQPNDRLVLYSSHKWPDTLIEHLYQATSLIDISNCFVLLAGPLINKDQVLQMSNGNDTFEVLVTEDINDTFPLNDLYVLSKSICPLPWTHLEIKNQGEIRACCISTKHFGEVPDTPIHTVFNGQEIKNFRQEFLNNNRPDECNACWRVEDQGLTSNRLRHLGLLKKDLLTKYMSAPEIVSLDLKPGNTCNFKCRICGPKSSSQFAQEYSKHNGIPIQSYNWAESSTTTINEIKDLLPNITNLDLYGGEPFLIKPLTELIEYAVNTGVASQLRLHYNSNGSVFPTELLKHWPHFKHVDIHFSIDNIGARFELERGGKWEEVNNNITQLVNLNLPNVKISIMPVISMMNIYYLDELLSWANDLRLPINALYLSRPAPFALSNLTHEAKKLIVNKFSNSTWPEMKQILRFIQTQADADGKEFVKLTQHFDTLRGQNFFDTHKEFANIIKIC
jgi:MoaA/NifB/PqqE/SkfB family radical SAM enzyme